MKNKKRLKNKCRIYMESSRQQRLRHVWNINGAHERRKGEEKEKKKRLIEYGRFSLVDKADNQLVKMLMHSPSGAARIYARRSFFYIFLFGPFRRGKLSADSNRLIYLFWMDVSSSFFFF